METIEVRLPTGFAAGGRWYRTARLRPLNGLDEEALGEQAARLLPVERAACALTRCLTALGPKSDIGPEDVLGLTVGDRDALLLHLRRLTYGDRVQSVLRCPQPDCGEKMDLDLSTGEVTVQPNLDAREVYEEVVKEDGAAYSVRFRLPTGADQLEVARHAGGDGETLPGLLLRRCVKGIRKDGVEVELDDGLLDAVAGPLSGRMAELDGQAEVLLNLKCPSCGEGFKAEFDIGDYFFKELIGHSREIHTEVHILALNYHWSERDILEMSRDKRRLYLKLLADTLNPE